jgi:hypothetical protein
VNHHACKPDDWIDKYYGLKCRVCGVFVPYGCEPWSLDDHDAADMVRNTRAETKAADPQPREPGGGLTP